MTDRTNQTRRSLAVRPTGSLSKTEDGAAGKSVVHATRRLAYSVYLSVCEFVPVWLCA